MPSTLFQVLYIMSFKLTNFYKTGVIILLFYKCDETKHTGVNQLTYSI